MSETNSEQKAIRIEERKDIGSSKQFHFDFPDELIGIIRPDEFQQSIDNINRNRRLKLWENIVLFILLLLLLVVSVTLVCICCILLFPTSRIKRLREARLQNAVDKESMKYSTKLPVPTVWRIDKVVTEGQGEDATEIVTYFLLIDIGQRADLEIRSDALNSNSTPSKPTSTIGQQYPILHLSQPNPSAMSFSNVTFQSEI